MKKLLCIFMVVCTLSLVVSAANENSNIYEYPELDLTIEFSEDSVFSQVDRQIIADSIAYDTPISQTYSLCWLVGHEFYTETVSALYHKKSEYSPRCQLEIYDVKKCRNCDDYVNPTLISSKYISCCPPEASAVSIDDSHTN